MPSRVCREAVKPPTARCSAPSCPLWAYSEGVEIARYSLLRLVLLLASAALLYLAGMRGALLWLSAIIVALLLAFILFPRTGDAAAERLKRAVQRSRRTADEQEDAILDAAGSPPGGDADAIRAADVAAPHALEGDSPAEDAR